MTTLCQTKSDLMAPPRGAPAQALEPLVCDADGCGYSTPEGAQDFVAILTCFSLHTQQAHSVQAPGNIGEGPVARPTCKVDKRAWPSVASEMSEHDWRFFLSEWQDYKRATRILRQNMLDQM